MTDNEQAPAKSASKAAWVDYAVGVQGMEADEAEGMTRDQLADKFSADKPAGIHVGEGVSFGMTKADGSQHELTADSKGMIYPQDADEAALVGQFDLDAIHGNPPAEEVSASGPDATDEQPTHQDEDKTAAGPTGTQEA